MKKTLLVSIFHLFFFHAFSQSDYIRTAQKPLETGNMLGNKNESCETLVFNTRELTNFAYNTKCKTEAYPFLSDDGKHLYFTNNQSYNWIFYSHLDSSTQVWSVPVPIQIAGFSGAIRSCTLSENPVKLFFISEENAVYRCESVGNSYTEFTNLHEIEINCVGSRSPMACAPFSNLSFTKDLGQMLAYTGNHHSNSMAAYIKTSDYSYTFMAYMSDYNSEMGALSTDGLSYFFTLKPYRNTLFCRKRNSLAESFSSEIFTVKEFEKHLKITQIRVNSRGEMVMVLSEDLWEKNDIFFYALDARDSAQVYEILNITNLSKPPIHEPPVEPVLIPEESQAKNLKTVEIINQAGQDVCKIEIGNPFPNPARSHFYIYFNVSGENPKASMPVIVLLDNSGRIVYRKKLESLNGEIKIEPDEVSNGVYFIRIDYNGLSSSMSKINISK